MFIEEGIAMLKLRDKRELGKVEEPEAFQLAGA